MHGFSLCWLVGVWGAVLASVAWWSVFLVGSAHCFTVVAWERVATAGETGGVCGAFAEAFVPADKDLAELV